MSSRKISKLYLHGNIYIFQLPNDPSNTTITTKAIFNCTHNNVRVTDADIIRGYLI